MRRGKDKKSDDEGDSEIINEEDMQMAASKKKVADELADQPVIADSEISPAAFLF